jgi:hypothetical protein
MLDGSQDNPLFEPCFTEQSSTFCNLLPAATGMTAIWQSSRLEVTETNNHQLKDCQSIRDMQKIYLPIYVYSLRKVIGTYLLQV